MRGTCVEAAARLTRAVPTPRTCSILALRQQHVEVFLPETSRPVRLSAAMEFSQCDSRCKKDRRFVNCCPAGSKIVGLDALLQFFTIVGQPAGFGQIDPKPIATTSPRSTEDVCAGFLSVTLRRKTGWLGSKSAAGPPTARILSWRCRPG